MAKREFFDSQGNYIGGAAASAMNRWSGRCETSAKMTEQRKRGPRIEYGPNQQHSQFRADIQQKLFYQSGYLPQNEFPRSVRDELDTPVDALSVRRDFIALNGAIPPARDAVNEIITRSDSSSDYPSFENDTIEKSVVMGAASSPETWPQWTKFLPVQNFNPSDFLMGVSYAAPGEVEENGEIPFSPAFDDGKETYRVRSFLARISNTRQMQVNGDFLPMIRLGYEMGMAIWRGVGNSVISVLTDNAALSDGELLFSSAHGNIASSPSAPSVSSLDEAFALTGAQQNAAGEYLNLQPKFIIAGPGYASTLAVLRNAISAPDPASGNTLAALVDSRLSGSTKWFTVADPIYGGICIAVLAGTENKPRIERLVKAPASAPDGTHYRVGYDYVVVPGNYRALTYNAGS